MRIPHLALPIIYGAINLMAVVVDADDVHEVLPVLKAHAHNDYYHERPLLDALDQGFCSVEADVFLVDGKLLVAHSKNEIKPDRTLERLYLEPLQRRVKKNGGRVYKSDRKTQLTLLVDFKSDGTKTYSVLHSLLAKYSDILSTVTDGKLKPNAVQVIVSGNRDFDTIAMSNPRFVGIDGRLKDLESDLPGHLVPMISDNWRIHFKWRGDGPMPEHEHTKLKEIVRKAHAAKRTVRLWATPENENLWSALHKAGVDHINTDQLARLSKFLRNMERK